MPPQHLHPLLVRHGNLLRPDRHKALGEGVVVFAEEPHCDHHIVDVVEDEGVLRGVVVPGLEEGDGVVAPVAEGVEVVRGVVAVVEAVAVGLTEGGVSDLSMVGEGKVRGGVARVGLVWG